MELSEIYDNNDYKKCLLYSLINLKNNWKSNDSIIYIIKSIISLDSFKVNSIHQCKILIFYYFYTLWKVEFEWGYSFVINNSQYKLWVNDIVNDNIQFEKFVDICNFWKNKHFLQDI